MVGWHHQLDEHEFDQRPPVSDGQGRLACCSPWGRKESDTTEWLNWLIYSSQPDFTCYLSYYLMIKVKEESEKADLKLNIQKTNIIVSGPIITWQTDREKMEIVTTFIFLHSKITADNDFSHEIKMCLLIGRKAMINLDSVLKNRAITLPTNVHIVKVILFLVVLYGCENWTIKKAECRIIDAFTLWCWRRPLRVLWTARRSNQSKEQSALHMHWKNRCWSSNNLPTWWEVPTHSKRPWCWERLKPGEERVTEDEIVGRHHQLNGHEFEQTMGDDEE